MITEQTGDKWTILQNNQSGFVATQSMSEYLAREYRPLNYLTGGGTR